jgi:glycine cleavage system H protein
VNFPEGLKYSKEHAWVRVEGAEAVLGISDHAQKQLGDIVFVEAPQVGAALTRSKPYGVVESVKSVSDLYAPVGGTVVRVNEKLASTPEIVNKDPYGDGWIVAVRLDDPSGLEGLMAAAAYQAYLAETAK